MAATRNAIRFVLNDRPVEVESLLPEDMLLPFLRENARLTGTKEGCAEGDCGACTVLVGRMEKGRVRYTPVNACIRPLASCDLCHVVTVEHLSKNGIAPVQRAMINHHGSQCGFCTPGIVMSLHALWMEDRKPTRDAVLEALQGNLCRCTGYAPILRAAEDMDEGPDPLAASTEAAARQLKEWSDGARVQIGGAVLPSSVDDFADVYAAHPDATIVAGATDVGLWVTKFMRDISPAIFVDHLRDMSQIDISDNKIIVGAGATYSDLMPVIAEHFPSVLAYWKRIGGWQVRSAGTIGGNVANGSPIGDTPPWLIAMDACLTLRHGADRREVPVADFFIDYGKQDRRPGEFVESLSIPKLVPGEFLAVEKISKRLDEDISSVSVAIRMSDAGGTVASPVLAYGGMAATPRRAAEAEAAVQGIRLDDAAALDTALRDGLARDFTPLTDWRASAEYRMKVARTLVLRAIARSLEAAA